MSAEVFIVSDKQDIEKAKEKMPKGTETLMIEGGNHRGFGSYTHQAIDWEVSTSLVHPSYRHASHVILYMELWTALCFRQFSCVAFSPQATITPDEQRRIIVEAITDFIKRRVVA